MAGTALLDAFAPGSIAVGVSVSSREQAISAAGDLLVASGRTTDAYTDAMLAVLADLGPYFVIAPSIAIAHARPSEAVLSAGLSLAVLRQPVVFGNSANDPVGLVFGLCALDHDSHLEVLSQLAEVLTDAERVNNLLNASTEADIRRLLS